MTVNRPTPGTALWVYAHPRPGSFNSLLFHAGVESLSKRYDVLTSDLHAQCFNPVLGDGDLSADVRAEQEKLASAELLVFQFPLWWYAPPAILKGWFDRVLTSGFAHGDIDPELGLPRRYGDGGLVGRRALIIVTAGEDARSIGDRGISGDIDSLLFPLTHGALWYVGIETLDLHVIYDADDLDAHAAEAETHRLQTRLNTIDVEQPRRFRRLKDGEYQGTRALRADILPGRTDLRIHLVADD